MRQNLRLAIVWPLPLLLSLSCAGCLLLCMLSGGGSPVFEATHPAAEQATPESEILAPSANPLGQRLQRFAQLGVTSWHAAGFRGRGVKIAILDSGFQGYQAHLGHALPARIAVHSFRRDGKLEAKNSQHGILCGEVIHALAPDAELLFANWEPDRPDQFLEAVRWARLQGARILSCSLIMPSWSDGEGGGATHAALTRLLGDGSPSSDMLCFASAGNTAQRHWSGLFHAASDGCHEWLPGQEDNELIPWGSDQVSVELCTQQAACYDVSVTDEVTRTTIVQTHASASEGRCTAVARFRPLAAHSYYVRVRLLNGPAGAFHLVALGGSLHYATSRGSIPFPADGPEVIAVGAVDGDGQRTAYSSCGPNSSRPKPDLVAPVPFPSLWRARPFSGTSAAAPQAAGLAALAWSKHPTWTATEVWDLLRSSARDLGAPGHDFETGYGMIHLP